MNAKELLQYFSVFPCNEDKSPAVKSWTPFRENKINPELLDGHKYFGLVAGFENLEIIDVDNHFGDADKLFQFISDNFNLDGFLIAKTGGGGYHIYYKCDHIEGNRKLAQRINDKDRPETLVETRGRGGYVVCPPSPWYSFISGSIDNVPTISIDDREELLNVCKALDEIPREKQKQTKQTQTIDGPSPIDSYHNDFSSRDETISLLRQNGWTSQDDKHWTRPGKNSGISATFGKVGDNKFYVFSSNAYPFQDGESYTMAGVRAMLLYNGDFSECAKELAKKYDIKPQKQKEKTEHKEPKDGGEWTASKMKWHILEKIMQEWSLKFRYNELINVVEYSKNGGRWEDPELLYGDIIHDMEFNRGVKSISKAKLEEMVKSRVVSEVYNPLKTFFSGLPKWDGKDHFDEICKYIDLTDDENPDYFYSMLKKHIIRSIRCATENNYVNRIVFTFHGPQEIGKTKFFQWLVDPEIYNEEMVNPEDKDSILALSRYLIINMDDIDSLNKKEVGKLKNFISKGDITKRLPYGKSDKKFKRIASFVASTNKSDILSDETNTRWVILKIKGFNWREYTKKVNPLQLWAQALAELNNDIEAGELSPEEKALREHRNNTQFLEVSHEGEILKKHFFYHEDVKMTVTEIAIAINEKYGHAFKVNSYQLSRELKRIYGDSRKTTRNGIAGRYYCVSHNMDALGGVEFISKNVYEVEKSDAPF